MTHFIRSHPTLASIALLLAALTTGCADAAPAHPWLDLGPDSPHTIVEFSGVDAGQIVIAMEPTVSPEEAMELGRLVRSQAPPDATVNARLYNDEGTARGWRTAPAEMRVEHLQVVVSVNPETGLDEVRWVRPDSLDAAGATSPGSVVGPEGGAAGDSAILEADGDSTIPQAAPDSIPSDSL